jgi:hypothetical protein
MPSSERPGMIDDGAAAYGENVWSWHPKLVSSLRRMRSAQPGRTNLNPKATVAIELSCRGERVISRKTIVWGMPDDPVPRCCSCASAVFCTRGRGCLWASRHSPRPLLSRGRDVLAKARALGAAGRLRASVIPYSVMAGPSPRRRSFGPAGGTAARRRAEPPIGPRFARTRWRFSPAMTKTGIILVVV